MGTASDTKMKQDVERTCMIEGTVKMKQANMTRLHQITDTSLLNINSVVIGRRDVMSLNRSHCMIWYSINQKPPSVRASSTTFGCHGQKSRRILFLDVKVVELLELVFNLILIAGEIANRI